MKEESIQKITQEAVEVSCSAFEDALKRFYCGCPKQIRRTSFCFFTHEANFIEEPTQLYKNVRKEGVLVYG